MNIPIKHGHWLKDGMDIQTSDIDKDRSVAVSIAGIEFPENENGGRKSKVCYVVRFLVDGRELLSRPVDTEAIDDALAQGHDVIEKALEWINSQPEVSHKFQGLTASFEQALLSSVEEVSRAGQPRLRI